MRVFSEDGRSSAAAERIKPGITQDGTQWIASLDGVHTVPIQAELGENIALALRVQDKIDAAIKDNQRQAFLERIRMMNCRKTFFAVRDKRSLKKFLRGERTGTEDASLENKEAMSGAAELKSDIERILRSGRTPLLGSSEDLQIMRYFDENPSDLPATVHVFNIPERFENEILSKIIRHPDSLSADECMTKLNRDHTFLVLGKDQNGKYICFQKQGAKVHHKFELRELGSLINLNIERKTNRIYLSLIGPVTTEEEKDKIRGVK